MNYKDTGLYQALKHYPGGYEYHLTVKISEKQPLHEFEQFCEQHNIKAIVIYLDGGKTPHQPMAGRVIRCTPDEAFEEITKTAKAMQQAGFALIRVKVEAGVNNLNIPQQDSDASGLSDSCYFEHHIKVALPDSYPLSDLRQSMKALDVHVSYNAFRKLNEHSEYFLTQRLYGVGKLTATTRLDLLLQRLKELEVKVIKSIQEFNIYDSKQELDDGWME
ncbi:hypothetical protein [Pleionea sp. CnH1-48]|uniref:hypothetical protein n=1 Tax=Pleionea sp. CnH1-48 TaxID=2954494 RepID=UPI002097683C|nr:hypothetical protein [Pleionea sp. CnH1-48]MCO7223188.1 hypothetical protein [Pleionea sp. CnH1-48]